MCMWMLSKYDVGIYNLSTLKLRPTASCYYLKNNLAKFVHNFQLYKETAKSQMFEFEMKLQLHN